MVISEVAASQVVTSNPVGISSFTATPTQAGNCIVAEITNYGSFKPTSLASSGITWAEVFSFTSDTYSIWLGTVTTPGSQTVTITWPSAIAGNFCAILQDELTFGGPADWSVLSSDGVSGNNGTALDWPSLTSDASAPNQCYWGAADLDTASGTPSLSSPGGFVMHTPGINPMVFGGGLALNTAFSPVGAVTTGGFTFEYGVIISAQPKVAALVDNFPGSSLGAQWVDASFGNITVSGNAVTLPCLSAYPAFYSAESYDLTGSAIVLHIAPMSAGDGTPSFDLTLSTTTGGYPSSNDIGVHFQGGSTYVILNQGGAQTFPSGGISSASQYYRIRESAGTIYVDYSTDAVSWSNLTSFSYTMPITALYVGFNSGYYGGNPSSSVVISNVNTAAGQVTGSAADSFTLTGTARASAQPSRATGSLVLSDSARTNAQPARGTGALVLSDTTKVSLYVQAAGTGLRLGGFPFHFTGFNLPYQMWDGESLSTALTDWGAYPAVARVFCFQTFNIVTGAINFTALDSMLSTFASFGIRVILVLGNSIDGIGGPNDDGALKDLAWWQGGSPNGYDVKVQSGSSPAQVVTYRNWVSQIVTRYKNNTTVMMWQLVNEAQAINDDGTGSESSAYTAMLAFANDVGGMVKGIDSNHLVSLGNLLGYNGGPSGQQWTGSQTYTNPPTSPTTTNADYQLLLANCPYLDVGDYHDYGYPTYPMGIPDSLTAGLIGLDSCLVIGAAVNKPIMVGEDGIDWTSGATINPPISPATTAERATLFAGKYGAMFPAGVVGVLTWSWRNNPQPTDGSDYGMEVGPSDPVLSLMNPATYLVFLGTATDSLVLTDSVRVSAQVARSTDSLVLTDSARVTSQRARAVDAFVLTDSARVSAQKVHATDALVLSDTARAPAQTVHATDALVLSDAATRTAALVAKATDAIALTDSARVSAQRAHSTDAFALVDSARTAAQKASAVDALVLTITGRASAQVSRAIDALALSDSAIGVLVVHGPATDAIVLTDTARASLVFARTLTDALALSDAARPTAQTSKVTGALILTDVVSFVGPTGHFGAATDAFVLVDSARISPQVVRSTDNLTLADAARVIAQTVHATDAFVLTLTVRVNAQHAGGVDAIILVDIARTTAQKTRSNDAISLTDRAVAASQVIGVSDALTLQDLLRINARPAHAVDVLILTDTARPALHVSGHATDVLHLVDVGAANNFVAHAADQIVLTDRALARQQNITARDFVVLSDTASNASGKSYFITDGFRLIDVTTFATGRTARASDQIALVDVATFEITFGVTIGRQSMNPTVQQAVGWDQQAVPITVQQAMN